MLYEIVGHREAYDTIPTESVYYETRTGVKSRVITIKGWQLKVKWESGKTAYISLKDIKKINPAEIL